MSADNGLILVEHILCALIRRAEHIKHATAEADDGNLPSRIQLKEHFGRQYDDPKLELDAPEQALRAIGSILGKELRSENLLSAKQRWRWQSSINEALESLDLKTSVPDISTKEPPRLMQDQASNKFSTSKLTPE